MYALDTSQNVTLFKYINLIKFVKCIRRWVYTYYFTGCSSHTGSVQSFNAFACGDRNGSIPSYITLFDANGTHVPGCKYRLLWYPLLACATTVQGNCHTSTSFWGYVPDNHWWVDVWILAGLFESVAGRSKPYKLVIRIIFQKSF